MARTRKSDGSGKGPTAPGFAFMAVSLVVLVVVSFLSFTARQPPPPTIAEFAPQAIERIEDAPPEQSSDVGAGEGIGEGGSPPPEDTDDFDIGSIELPRVRRCVGNPPRQIEDPQSPPCVPYWAGDNGGATWRGVTASEIRIFVPTGNPDQSASPDIFPVLERFFNARFTFYGRKLKFIYGGAYPNAGTTDVASQVAAAVDADEKHDAFASLRWRTAQGFYYHQELTRRRIPSVTGVEWGYDSSYLREKDPYLWTYTVENDVMLDNMGEWACKRLAGRTAEHAGDADLRGRTRAFGVVLQTYYNGEETSTAPLTRRLKRCDAAPEPVLENPMQAASGKEDDQTRPDAIAANNVVLNLKNAEVTSVVCICQPYAAGALMKAASNQAYFPEWIFSSYGAHDLIWGVRLGGGPAEQLSQMFGITFLPRQIRAENEPYRWAVRESDPTYPNSNHYGTTAIFNFTYRNILELASGIQMAGPKLTPQTLAEGLRRARFPNPAHPNRPGAVGFSPNRAAMTTDAAEWWYSGTTLSPYDTVGAHCYLNGGARHSLGRWPSGRGPFFKGPCDSGA